MKIKIFIWGIATFTGIVIFEFVRVFDNQYSLLNKNEEMLKKSERLLEKISYQNPKNLELSQENYQILNLSYKELLESEKKVSKFFNIKSSYEDIDINELMDYYKDRKDNWQTIANSKNISYNKDFISLKIDTLVFANYYLPALTFMSNFFSLLDKKVNAINEFFVSPSKELFQDYFLFDSSISLVLRSDGIRKFLKELVKNSGKNPYLLLIENVQIKSLEDIKLSGYKEVKKSSYMANQIAFSGGHSYTQLLIKAKLLIKNEN